MGGEDGRVSTRDLMDEAGFLASEWPWAPDRPSPGPGAAFPATGRRGERQRALSARSEVEKCGTRASRPKAGAA